ncbi:MAG: GNAT family N-acetyltransferase [Thermoplasmata archaeon]
MSSPRYRLREAGLTDVGTLVDHRHRMYSAIGGSSEAEIAAHDARYRRWARVRLRRRELVGQIAETSDGQPVASGCLWYRPEQPRPQTVREDVTPYILSMFTVPEHRGRGLASRITKALIADARRNGHGQVVLHASPQGRPVYVRIGFERRWEMRYWMDPAMKAAHARRRPTRFPPRRSAVGDTEARPKGGTA